MSPEVPTIGAPGSYPRISSTIRSPVNDSEGRDTIWAQRGAHPANRHFTVLRIVGGGDLWVSECILAYDIVPSHSVSSMEFGHGSVVHETQYFGDAFGSHECRAELAGPMPGRDIVKA